MKKMILTMLAASAMCLAAVAQDDYPWIWNRNPEFKVIVDTSNEPIAPGPFEPTVDGLSGYECPEWFRDAKFGIWAHWGPQCQPEDGDWYGRYMYMQGNSRYKYNIDTRDHPSRFGFKDWIHEWKAENWDPEALVNLYKETGAKYFMAMANHHDNFDLYASRYQAWNSTALGPCRDIVGEWEKACRKAGLRFGVSVHAAHAWTWYETSRGSDTTGPLAGVPYDGVLTKEDGAGTWWEGLDPQDLYEQRHELSPDSWAWEWQEGKVTTPDQAYCDRIYNRTVQLIADYGPDVVYLDDTYVPLWPISDAGLKIVADAYNRSAAANGGNPQIVMTGKILSDWQKQTLVWDVEMGVPDDIQPLPWQTCTCLGHWHYDKHRYYDDKYKSSAAVIWMLADVVSKNGNLLLSVPLKGDGTLDPTEQKIVAEIGNWMRINGESIYGTRPWKVFGEGPLAVKSEGVADYGVSAKAKPQPGAADMRFAVKGDKTLYVTVFGLPETETVIESLGRKTGLDRRRIRRISMLGSGEKVSWSRDDSGLHIAAPQAMPAPEALVYKIEFR